MNSGRRDTPFPRGGPVLLGSDPWTIGNPHKVHQLLTDDERARLSVFASLVRFRKGQTIYRAGEPTDAIYNIVSGVVKAFNGHGHITAFLFAGDLVGLSEEGHYANSTAAVAPVTAYRLPVARLRRHLRQEAQLEFHVISKLCQELRQTQRHAFLVATRDATSRVAMFLQLLEELQANRDEPTIEIHVPMSRSDIAQYVGLSAPAVTRAFAKLAADGVIEARNRQHIKVRDRARFEHLAIHSPAGR